MNALEEHGFEIISHVFGSDSISSLATSLEQSSNSRSRAGMRNALQIDAVRSVAQSTNLLDLAKNILGENTVPFRATLFDKSENSNWLVVWHQDTALPLRERRDVPGWGPWSMKQGVICAHAPAGGLEQVLAIRVHLDDCTRENGPLRVLPGTHKSGVLSDDSIRELAARIPAFECQLSAGSVLLMKPLLVHASSKARNGVRRRVLHIEYSAITSFEGTLELLV